VRWPNIVARAPLLEMESPTAWAGLEGVILSQHVAHVMELLPRESGLAAEVFALA
jgi:hypothetical protein